MLFFLEDVALLKISVFVCVRKTHVYAKADAHKRKQVRNNGNKAFNLCEINELRRLCSFFL
jgi:hypothetical protein